MPAVILEQQTGIATIRLNRVEKHNAFNDAIIAELIHILKQLQSDDNCRVLILSANGDSFSAGADLEWMQRMKNYSTAENITDAQQLATLMDNLYHFNKPTIVLVQGAAYGGALGLIACCDIAVATPNATFCFSEVKLGLIPAVISPYVINAIGKRALHRYFLTAELFSAATAAQLGLIHSVVAAQELESTGQQLAKKLLQNSPQALTAAKSLLLNDNDQASLSKLIAQLRVSTEGQEGLQAFLEKRTPNW